YYRKQAQQWLIALVAATPSNAFLPMALLEPLVNEYETLKWGHFRAPPLTAPEFASALYDYAYLQRAEDVAATVGQVVGTALLQRDGVLSTVAAYQSAAVARTQKDVAPIVAREAQRRLPWSAAVVATGTSIQPALAF